MRFIFTKHKKTTKASPQGKRKIKTFNAFFITLLSFLPPPRHLQIEAVPPIELPSPQTRVQHCLSRRWRHTSQQIYRIFLLLFLLLLLSFLGFQGIPPCWPRECAWKFDKLLFDFIAVFAQISFYLLWPIFLLGGISLSCFLCPIFYFIIIFLFTFMCLLFDAGFGALPSEKLRHFLVSIE